MCNCGRSGEETILNYNRNSWGCRVALLMGTVVTTLGYGQAETYTLRVSEPFSSKSTNLCDGEVIQFDGKINLVFHSVFRPDGLIY